MTVARRAPGRWAAARVPREESDETHSPEPSPARPGGSIRDDVGERRRALLQHGRYVGAAVRSLLDDQPGVDVRVLIIDDAFTDGSEQVVKEIAASDPRVEAVLHGTNQGLVRTCNEGVIDWADGEYTVVLDANDG